MFSRNQTSSKRNPYNTQKNDKKVFYKTIEYIVICAVQNQNTENTNLIISFAPSLLISKHFPVTTWSNWCILKEWKNFNIKSYFLNIRSDRTSTPGCLSWHGTERSSRPYPHNRYKTRLVWSLRLCSTSNTKEQNFYSI